jgi:transposase InsO family protein
MPYTTNPRIERVRMEAVRMVLSGKSTVETACHFGYSQSAVVKWVQRASFLPQNAHSIPTRTSRPHRHPKELPKELVSTILRYRAQRGQCAEILHHRLTRDGCAVSLSSVKRTLRRHGISRFSKWKKWHQYPPRPMPESPGILVQMDSMREGLPGEGLYVYAAIDVCSRVADAQAVRRINTRQSTRFIRMIRLPFAVRGVQTDHGSEFSRSFTATIEKGGIAHHRSRVRTPTDNTFVERFIQTLQRDCLSRIPRNLKAWRKEIPEYIRYYNAERPHMGLGYQTPLEALKLFQAID